jgi:hypothetical protein
MADGFLIGSEFLGRIRRTVDAAEAAPMRMGVTKIPTRFEGDQATPVERVFRICTFTGEWTINASKSVAFRGVTTTPNTVSVVNLTCGLSVGTNSCDISIAKDGTAWYLVEANLTKQPGYSGDGTHVLTVQGGFLKWMPTTAC